MSSRERSRHDRLDALNSGASYAQYVDVSGEITDLTSLRLKDLEDRGIGSIVITSVTATDRSRASHDLPEGIGNWAAAAVATGERVQTHGASAEEAAKKLADVLEELVGTPLTDGDVEAADSQLQQLKELFAERGFTLLVHEVEPNVWHADWFPHGTGRTTSGLSPLRAARQALLEL